MLCFRHNVEVQDENICDDCCLYCPIHEKYRTELEALNDFYEIADLEELNSLL
jgi:pyruvate formate-lyase activating enzyme-like uncharacterized protein